MIDRRGRAWAAVVALAVAVIVTGCTKSGDPTPNGPEGGPTATNVDGSVSFPVTDDTPAAVKLAGLPMLSKETAADQVRAHLQVIVNGKSVTVPANIGVDVEGGQISPLHTHDETGVVHIEAGEQDTIRVGQLFLEWGVPLDKTCLGSFCADENHQLLGFDNGQLVPDPASIPFEQGSVIVIWFGPKGSNPEVATTYAFPQ
jgi:hypothetical protein